MNLTLNQDGQHRLMDARMSETGDKMTDAQFDEVWAMTGIMDRTIRSTGVFAEKLTDMAHAYARTQKFGAPQAETIIRDIYEARYDQTMNDRRKALVEAEEKLPQAARNRALDQARDLRTMISDGETMPLYRAIDIQANDIADRYAISEAGAKRLMASMYQQAEGRSLYDDMKAVEAEHHAPKMRKDRAQRQSRADGGKSYARSQRMG